MPISVERARLVEISHELRAMAYRGVHLRRLGRIALDISLSKAAAKSMAGKAGSELQREWTRRSLDYLERLEAEVVRLYSAHVARRRMARRPNQALSLVTRRRGP